MFREKVIEWGRFLRPSVETRRLVGGLGRQLPAMSRKDKERREYRPEVNLDVSRAYIKLAQFSR